MLSTCIDWFEIQDVPNVIQILCLHKIRRIATQKAGASKAYKEITNYFEGL